MRTVINQRSVAQRGSILLEGLIAILIFSVGILAIVVLQATAIKNSADAKYRGDASYLANQIIGQMWADRSNLATYANFDGAGNTCYWTGTASANPNVISWLAEVGSAIPSTGTIKQQIHIGAFNQVAVTVCWQSPKDNVLHNFVAVAQING